MVWLFHSFSVLNERAAAAAAAAAFSYCFDRLFCFIPLFKERQKRCASIFFSTLLLKEINKNDGIIIGGARAFTHTHTKYSISSLQKKKKKKKKEGRMKEKLEKEGGEGLKQI